MTTIYRHPVSCQGGSRSFGSSSSSSRVKCLDCLQKVVCLHYCQSGFTFTAFICHPYRRAFFNVHVYGSAVSPIYSYNALIVLSLQRAP